MNAFKFGTIIDSRVDARADLVHLVRRAEDLGFDCIYLSDHLDHRLSPVAGLSAIGQMTSRLRVGHLVLNADIRHPVSIAADGATLDILTDGRFELGLGAGWKESDYSPLGLNLGSASMRIARLEESIKVIRQCWVGADVASSEFYDISNLLPLPRPVQRPYPPLLIGAGGRQMLELAGRQADIVNILPRARTNFTDLSTDRPLRLDRNHAFAHKAELVTKSAGARIDEIQISATVFALALDYDLHESRETREDFTRLGKTLCGTPWCHIGSARSIADRIQIFRDRFNLSHLVCYSYAMTSFAPIISILHGK